MARIVNSGTTGTDNDNREADNVELSATGTDNDNREAGVRGDEARVDRNVLKDQRDFDLVVGTLIATVSFTAGITVPMDEPNQIPPSSSGATRSVKKKREMDPFYNIVWHGDVDYFKQVPVDVLLNSRDEHGDSILSKAVIKQYISLVKVIYERCPELLYCQNNHGHHALHHAAARQNLEVLNFIINADVESQGRGANKRLTRMQDNDGNVALMHAVQAEVVAKNVELLITADPEFYPPPNHEDETPLKWCMSQSRRYMLHYFGMEDMISDMFKLLLRLAPNQSKTHMGSNGWTILHYAASEGDLCSIAYILQFCPDCSKEVDSTGQNFRDIAAQRA